MIHSEVPSDTDVSNASRDHLHGRLVVYRDLHSEFQGAWPAYMAIGKFIPIAILVAVYFGWFDAGSRGRVLVTAALIFAALCSIAIYALVWERWLKKRVDRLQYEIDRRDAKRKQPASDLMADLPRQPSSHPRH